MSRSGVADESVTREIERKRSFQRTKERATALRDGEVTTQFSAINETLKAFGWSEEGRALFEHQQQGAVHGLTAVNAANFSVPGSGKTAIALAVAATHMANKIIDVVLVIGPLSCFGPWEKEVRAALSDCIRTRRIRGATAHRRRIYPMVGPKELLLISFATAVSDQGYLVELCRAHRVMLVVDESHRIKRFRGGVWAPALMEIAKYARVRFILSGTPMPQNGRDLYTQLNILWPGGELTGPRDSFAARVDHNFQSILRDIRPFMARTPKSALDLPDYKIVRHEVPLTGTQAEIYDLIESNFRRRIEGASDWQSKLESLRRGRPIRLLQAATNPDLLNRLDVHFRLPPLEKLNPTLMERLATYRRTNVPAKTVAALDLVRELAEQGQKIVCWSNFVPNLDQFSHLIRKELRILCLQIDGRVPVGDEALDDDPKKNRANPNDADTRERIIDEFLKHSGPAVLVTNPASCSESISLHRTCHNAIYIDRTYDCALFLQSIDRIHRLGLPPNVDVRVHIILATIDGRPTVDHLVEAALARKEGTMRRLLDGAELLPFQLSSDPLDEAEGDYEDLGDLLRFLLGEEN